MELWIRSQDKEDLLEVHNLGLAYKGKYCFMDKIGDIDGYCICEFINDYHVKLGSYKSKERALEVLDHIQFLIEQTGELTEVILEYIGKLLKDEMWSINSTSNTATYEMPKR